MDEARRQLRTVLVGTDFSMSANLAVERAIKLPLAPGATVHLVHVVPAQVPERLLASVQTNAKEALSEAAATFEQVAKATDPSLSVASEILEGHPHVELIRMARRVNAELVVVGRHGKHSLREKLLGSTTERVVRHSEIPTLVVTSKKTSPYRCPMVAVDLADDLAIIQGLVDLALMLIAPDADRLMLVHAFQAPFERRLRYLLGNSDLAEYRAEYKQEAIRALMKLRGDIVAPNVAVRTVLARGEPERSIVREASRRGADLLVLGTHGRRGIAHALLGSVAEEVLRRATCDIAILRPRDVRFEEP